MSKNQGIILVADDNEINRKVLKRNLLHEGFDCVTAENGVQALQILRSQPCDVVILDLMMPEMDGFQVLEAMKADEILRHLPVIVISALDETENAIRCIEMGASDYMMKPFDAVFLRARVNASLSSKRLHDMEEAFLRQIQAEQQQSERLLLNILPAPIAARLKNGEQVIVDSFSDVTVLFADIVGFTRLAVESKPDEIVNLLNAVFSIFDELAQKYKLEKIKTIGDAYMVAGGIPTFRPDHAEAVANMALDIQKIFTDFKSASGQPLKMRMGIHTGPVVAGVIGIQKFIYDLWGDTVNIASRMESQGLPGQIQVSSEVYTRLQSHYQLEERGVIEMKGRGAMQTYWLSGRQ